MWKEQQWLGAAEPFPVPPGLQDRQCSHPVCPPEPATACAASCSVRNRGQGGAGGIPGMWARSWEMQQEQIWSFERVQECWACVFEEEGFTLPTV